MKIVITCALPFEFNEARNQLSLKEITSRNDMPRIASMNNIYLIHTGIGKLNSTVNLFKILQDIKPDLVLDSGTCGSLVDSLKPMDIIVSTHVIDFYSYNIKGDDILSNDELVKKNFLHDLIFSDIIIASIEDRVVDKKNVELLKQHGASIVTWETSAIFKLCKALNINFLSIRGVTDNCNAETDKDFKKNKIELCKKLYNSIKMLCKGI